MQTWQMQHAKAHLADLLKAARENGPQTVTVHGKPAVVVLSTEAYQRLAGTHESLAAFMQRSPLVQVDDGDELMFDRDRSLTREIAL